ncbi:hypothetical protein D0Z00_004072 [Geotrichum galactomycetum]|uniref:Uncharacterized protein n=1 Tax=Geotrichum galactomycetum TaxID=27317 RepID=A0ACB6UZH5_9ASCO|nr:hypothetical protein D0Z00_004072 [Geotrichum candidum]
MVPPQRHFKNRHVLPRQLSDEDEEDAFAQMLGGTKACQPQQQQQQRDSAPNKPRLTLSRASSVNPQKEHPRPRRWMIEIRGLDPALSHTEVLQALYLDGLISKDRLSVSTDPGDSTVILLGIDNDTRAPLDSIIDFWDGKYIGGGITLSVRLAGVAPAVQKLASNKKTITLQQHRVVTAFVEQVLLNDGGAGKVNSVLFVAYAKEQLFYDARFSFLFAGGTVSGMAAEASALYMHYQRVLAHPLVGIEKYQPAITCLGTLNAQRLVLLLQNAESRRRGDIARVLGFAIEQGIAHADEILQLIVSAVTAVKGNDNVNAADNDISDAALYVLNDLAYNMPELRPRIISYLPATQAARLEEWQRGWGSTTGANTLKYSENDGTEMSAADIDFYNSFLD